MYLVKTPSIIKRYYSSLTWNKSRSEKIIYLTFDDGPIPNVTEFVLNTLKSFAVKATFFCIGDNIVKHPALFNRIKQEGHTVGNHTFNHLNGWKTSDEIYLQNVLECQELTATTLFRPPYGRIRKSQVKHIQDNLCSSPINQPITKPEIIMWDVLSGDFDPKISAQTCYQNVIKHTENGSIIVFHDSLKAADKMQYALPRVIRFFLDQGFQFGTL